MTTNFIEPFVSATDNVFATMLNCRVARGEVSPRRGHRAQYEVNGVIGLSGHAAGSVIVSLDETVALHATEAMLGHRPATIDADVIDAVGELTNMIAGKAKMALEEYAMSLALPTVIVGKEAIITFPSGVQPARITFTSDWGPLAVEVGLVERGVAMSAR